jgi:hypothetical protein
VDYDNKDFSMYLSHELIKSFGLPYQSSITTVKRFIRDDLRICLDYKIVSDSVDITGVVPIGGVTLSKNDAIDFFKEINELVWAVLYSVSTVGNNVSIIPYIDFTLHVGLYEGDKKAKSIIEIVNSVFSELAKIKTIILKYKEKEVGYPKIEQIWEEANKTTNTIKKGKLLEQLFVQLIQIDGSFMICEKNVKTKSEEIDIVLQPDTTSPFWSRISPPMILLECKNWKDKVGAKEVRDFAGKIENRPKILCRIGFFVAIVGFTKGAEEELIGYRARDFILATITGNQIEELIKTKRSISELLQRRLINAGFR